MPNDPVFKKEIAEQAPALLAVFRLKFYKIRIPLSFDELDLITLDTKEKSERKRK